MNPFQDLAKRKSNMKKRKRKVKPLQLRRRFQHFLENELRDAVDQMEAAFHRDATYNFDDDASVISSDDAGSCVADDEAGFGSDEDDSYFETAQQSLPVESVEPSRMRDCSPSSPLSQTTELSGAVRIPPTGDHSSSALVEEVFDDDDHYYTDSSYISPLDTSDEDEHEQSEICGPEFTQAELDEMLSAGTVMDSPTELREFFADCFGLKQICRSTATYILSGLKSLKYQNPILTPCPKIPERC